MSRQIIFKIDWNWGGRYLINIVEQKQNINKKKQQLTFDNEIVNLTAQTLMDDESKPVECYEQEENQLIECGRVQNKLVICDDLYSNNVSQNVRNALKEEKQKKNENAMYNSSKFYFQFFFFYSRFHFSQFFVVLLIFSILWGKSMEWSNGKLLRDHDRPNARREPARKRPNTEQPQPKPEPVAAGNAEELRSHLIHLLAEEGKATSITAIVKKSKGFTPTAINSALHQVAHHFSSLFLLPSFLFFNNSPCMLLSSSFSFI